MIEERIPVWFTNHKGFVKASEIERAALRVYRREQRREWEEFKAGCGGSEPLPGSEPAESEERVEHQKECACHECDSAFFERVRLSAEAAGGKTAAEMIRERRDGTENTELAKAAEAAAADPEYDWDLWGDKAHSEWLAKFVKAGRELVEELDKSTRVEGKVVTWHAARHAIAKFKSLLPAEKTFGTVDAHLEEKMKDPEFRRVYDSIPVLNPIFHQCQKCASRKTTFYEDSGWLCEAHKPKDKVREAGIHVTVADEDGNTFGMSVPSGLLPEDHKGYVKGFRDALEDVELEST